MVKLQGSLSPQHCLRQFEMNRLGEGEWQPYELLVGFPLLKIILVGGVTRVNTGCGGFYGCGPG